MRREDWPERLGAVIVAAMDRPFEWGKWDCAHFMAACVEAITGADPMPLVRGRYDSEFGASRQIRRFGKDLAETCDAKFGARIPLNFAQRGDVLMHDGNLGICVDHAGLFLTPEGLTRIDVGQCSAAWRIA